MSIIVYILLTPPALLALMLGALDMVYTRLVRFLAPKGSVSERWSINLFISWDQLLNAAAAGDPDETMSGHAGRLLRDGSGCKSCLFGARVLCFLLTMKHCKDYASPPGEYRNGLLTYRRERKRTS